MPDIHDNGRALATRMLAPRPAGKGAPLRMVRSTPATRDPATGTSAPASVTNYDGSGLRTMYDARDVDGTQIRSLDVRMLVSPVLLNGAGMPEIAPGDRLEFEGRKYTVINSKAWNYAGVSCGFEVQARV